mgnify:CR=1 FL=1
MRPGIILPESEGFVTGCIRITRVESRGAKRTQAVHESKDSLRAGESDNYWKRACSLTQLTVRERKEAEGEPQQSLVAMGSKGDGFLDELWGVSAITMPKGCEEDGDKVSGKSGKSHKSVSGKPKQRKASATHAAPSEPKSPARPGPSASQGGSRLGPGKPSPCKPNAGQQHEPQGEIERFRLLRARRFWR